MSYPTGVVINCHDDIVGRIASLTSQGARGAIADSFLYQPVSGQRYAWCFETDMPRKDAFDADGRMTLIYRGRSACRFWI